MIQDCPPTVLAPRKRSAPSTRVSVSNEHAQADIDRGSYGAGKQPFLNREQNGGLGASTDLAVQNVAKIMSSNVLLLPGYRGSGPEHWQTLWEKSHPHFRRVNQRDWQFPACREWVETLDLAVARTHRQAVVVAHSLGCLTVAHWAAWSEQKIQGALLVAPPDPKSPKFPKEAFEFDPIPREKLSFKSIVVASSNDSYGSLEFAKRCAEHWGSEFVNAGPIGHINAESRLGDWPEGLSLLKRIVK